MLSRVAYSMYWMNRYIERAENVVRAIEVNSHMTLDMLGETDAQWMPLVMIGGSADLFEARGTEPSARTVIEFLAFDQDNPNSILSCLHAARENARSIRPTITSEMWEQINRMYLYVTHAAQARDIFATPHEFYARLKLGSHLFSGIMEATMTHNEGWHFGRLGRMLERADQTTRLLDVKYFILLPAVDHVGLSVDDNQWAALLHSASALEMYRQKHGEILPDRIVEFLLLDIEFPRAVLHCLNRADASLRTITGSREGTFHCLPEQRLGQLRSDLAYLRVEEIIAAGLHDFLDNFQARINVLGDAIRQTFFAPVIVAQQEGNNLQ